MLRAVIDIGTVTTRMMIAECSDGKVKQLEKRATITQLGQGLVDTGRLSSAAIARVANAVDEFISIMESHGMDLSKNDASNPFVIAIATSAARDASNSDELVAELQKRNIHLAVISGDREARLSYAGATSDFHGSNILVSDIGGGSTELIYGNAVEGQPAQIIWRHSFDIGCRRVTDMFLKSDPPDPGELNQASAWAMQQMSPYFIGDMHVEKMIGVAGTATSLVSIADSMEVYDSSKVHGRVMSELDVRQVYRRLRSMTLDERKMVIGLQPQRASVMVAGLLILIGVMELANVDEFTVSESDNMMGLMLDWPDDAIVS